MRARPLLLMLAVGATTLTAVAHAADAKPPDAHSVPYRLADTKHILVRARINGKGPFTFILDTGAPALFLAKSAAAKIGVKPDKNGWVEFQRFEVEGGVVVPKARARVEDLAPVEAINGMGLAGVEVHGLLGYNILAHYRIELDLTRDKMTWTRLPFDPEMPRLGGKGGMPTSINAIGAVMKFVGALMGKKPSGDAAGRGFLGVELAESGGFVVVQAVLPDSPAAAAGLRPGDWLTRFQDRPVRSLADLQRRASQLTAGADVQFTVRRAGAYQAITFKAGEGL